MRMTVAATIANITIQFKISATASTQMMKSAMQTRSLLVPGAAASLECLLSDLWFFMRMNIAATVRMSESAV